jgi:serine/threonine protein kinase
LEHPSIVPVHELGTREDGSLFYTMKYVRGITLSEAMEKARSLENRHKLLPHILDVCQAIAYAHSRGVIHRDIKPANIMVGPFGETVLLDWGLARIKGEVEERNAEIDSDELPVDPGAELASGWTGRGEVLGTPAFMSPEQADGNVDAIGERSDVYGLGTLLYVALTGEAPHKGKNRRETLSKVRAGAPKPILELVPRAPAELAAICEKAMARDPERRYQSADQVAEDWPQPRLQLSRSLPWESTHTSGSLESAMLLSPQGRRRSSTWSSQKSI